MLNARLILLIVVVATVVLVSVWQQWTTTSSDSSQQQQQIRPSTSVTAQGEQLSSLASSSVADLEVLIPSMIECSGQLHLGKMFDRKSSKCVDIPGWLPALQEFELAPDELSCADDSLPSSRWIAHAFEQQQQKTRNVSDFVLRTSWLFHRYMFFERSSSSSSSTRSLLHYYDSTIPAANFKFRSYHDSSSQNIFRVENFCVHPTGGLHAVWDGQPISVGTYQGKDESYDYYHSSPSFELYLARIKKISAGSLAGGVVPVTDRGAVFIYLSPLSRDNLWHSFHRFLNLMGTLNLRPFGGSSPSDSAALLILFVFDDYPDQPSPVSSSSSERVKKQKQQLQLAFGFLYRLLDVPYAVVSNAGSASSTVVLRPWHERTHHAFFPPQRSDLSENNVFESLATEMKCFRRGVAIQNCYACSAERDSATNVVQTRRNDDGETYSFGMFDPLTPKRALLLAQFRLAVQSCIPARESSSSSSSVRSVASPRKPRVFFDLRTTSRTVVDFGMIAADLKRLLVGTALSALDFREAAHGSRARYIQEVRECDIFIGVHGSAFSNIVLLDASGNRGLRSAPRRVVIIEITSSLHMCTPGSIGRDDDEKQTARNANNNSNNNNTAEYAKQARCWFGSYVDFLEQQQQLDVYHWLIQVDADRRLRPRDSFRIRERPANLFVPSSLIQRVLRDAAEAVTVLVSTRRDMNKFRHYVVTLEEYGVPFVLELLELFFGATTIVFDDDAETLPGKNPQLDIVAGAAFVSAMTKLRRLAANADLLMSCDWFESELASAMRTGDFHFRGALDEGSSETAAATSCPKPIVEGWKRFALHYLAREIANIRFRRITPSTQKVLAKWRYRTRLCARVGNKHEVLCLTVFTTSSSSQSITYFPARIYFRLLVAFVLHPNEKRLHTQTISTRGTVRTSAT